MESQGAEPMRQINFAVDARTLGDLRSEGRERLMTLCDKCGNTSSLSLEQLIHEYRAEARVLHVLAILHTRCAGRSGVCEMKLRE
jgi:hypothetical protein